jgi:hypothetical protein
MAGDVDFEVCFSLPFRTSWLNVGIFFLLSLKLMIPAGNPLKWAYNANYRADWNCTIFPMESQQKFCGAWEAVRHVCFSGGIDFYPALQYNKLSKNFGGA